MVARATVAAEIRQLLTGEHADPRAAQVIFLVPVAVELLLHLVASAGFDSYFAYGSLVVAVATVASFVIASGTVSNRWTIWLPVLDMAALGIYWLSDDTSIWVAVAFPAIWLGLQFGLRGVLVTVGTVLAVFVLPLLVTAELTLLTFSRVTQLTLVAVICSSAVATTAGLWKTQVQRTRAGASRLERAVTDSMNPRHQDFMSLAYRRGHDGVAGQSGFVFGADGETPLVRDEMPTVRAVRGEAFRDYLIWVGGGPCGSACARGLSHALPPGHGRVRWRGARLSRHHRTGAGLERRGRVRRVGQPRAPDAADLDHRLRRRDPGRHRGRARRGAGAPDHRPAQRPSTAPTGRRPSLDRTAVGDDGARRRAHLCGHAAAALGHGRGQGCGGFRARVRFREL